MRHRVPGDKVCYGATGHFGADDVVEEQIHCLIKATSESPDVCAGAGPVFSRPIARTRDLCVFRDSRINESWLREGSIPGTTGQSATYDDWALIKDRFLEVVAHGDVTIKDR